ncbi:MAG: MBL fold metallo-hydrolase [Bradyrhizobiaceae bacterium]|nr:MBL fold metallo-hydrolase [Bradyrhizobiaceae bacterium]
MILAAQILCVVGPFSLGASPIAALAQAAAPGEPKSAPEMRANCPAFVASRRNAIPVAGGYGLAADEVRITYAGHSTFLIESPKLVRIATDYNDYVRPPVLPDIATMNHAHATHYTDRPDPDIKFVLRGWRPDGGPANHDLTYSDVHVRSVSTNIRDWNGGTEKNGNSIFIFEVGSLCIAHLGHLHHTLTQQQLDDIGHVDVLLVPVDGGYTLDLDGMVEVIHAIKAPLMVPMHFFSTFTLHRFLDRVRQEYDIEFAETPSFVVSKATLPSKSRFMVLPGH